MTTETDMAISGGFDSYELKLGDELRGERATLGKSLLDVQRDLRIKAAYIAAIENCDLSVFPNTSFLAGYVRSYARYLKLDPEATYARFCTESNFQGSNADIGRARMGGSDRVAAISAASNSGWTPGLGGVAMSRQRSFAGVASFAPVIVILLLILGLGYGVLTLIKDIQRVDIAPIEQSPTVLDTFESGGFAEGLNNESLDRGAEQALDLTRIYASSGFDVPIVTPRDGPIAAIDPQQTGSVMAQAQTLGSAPIALLAQVETTVEIGAPQVRAVETVQTVSIFAQRPAWVRVSGADGAILFEKILEVGEEYTLPAGVDMASLRAGNADWVYVLVDGQAYGPISGTNGVVNGFSLAAAEIQNSLSPLGTMTAEMRAATEEIRRAAALVSD